MQPETDLRGKFEMEYISSPQISQPVEVAVQSIASQMHGKALVCMFARSAVIHFSQALRRRAMKLAIAMHSTQSAHQRVT